VPSIARAAELAAAISLSFKELRDGGDALGSRGASPMCRERQLSSGSDGVGVDAAVSRTIDGVATGSNADAAEATRELGCKALRES
jgi:hypothetical protein